MGSTRARYLDAIRGLTEPRRLAALVSVLLALLVTEAVATRSPVALALDALLFAVFVAVAPGSFRVLGARGGAGLLAYGALGVASVGAVAGVVSVASPRWTYVVDPGSLAVLAVLFLVGGWGLGRDVDLTERAHALALTAERRALEARAATLRAEQNALLAQRAQLDPHFLFNVLNAIAELCRQDPVRAEEATLALASMLRTMLDATRAPTWPLSKELGLVTEVTELYAMRDRGRYRFRLELAPCDDVAIPPLLLLPVIENAVTHGPGADHEGEVWIVVERAPGSVQIRVGNPGPFAGPREGGEGLGMVRRRLALAFGDAGRFEIEARDGETLASLSIPATGPEAVA